MTSFYNREILPRARNMTRPAGGFTKETYDVTVAEYWQAKKEKTETESKIDRRSNDECGNLQDLLNLGKKLNDAAGKYERCKDILFTFYRVNSDTCPAMIYYPNSSTNDKGEELPRNYMDFAE